MELKSFRRREKLSIVRAAKTLINVFRAAHKICRIVERRQMIEMESAGVYLIY
jgi:hypothetical protein